MDESALSPRPDGGPRKLPKDARRTQIIEATIDTLATLGYARTTLSEVARVAGLSHGLINFHFKTKDGLLAETLLYLADEYRANWTAALQAAGDRPEAQLRAMLEADFNPAICTMERLSAWCAFWGEAQSRPIYQDRCGANDEEYIRTLESICARMIAAHGARAAAPRVARILRVTTEGLWLDLMTTAAPFEIEEARKTLMVCAGAIFPAAYPMAAD